MRRLLMAALVTGALAACATARPATTGQGPEGVPTEAPPAQPAPREGEKPGPVAVEAVPLQATAPLELVLLPNPSSPIVTFRLVFRTGSVDDPKGKEGLTALTAALMSEGGTKSLSSAQLIEALFPMAAELSMTVDKELTVYAGRVHRDFLPRFLPLFAEVLTAPRFDPRELERLKANALTAVRNTLRNDDDETLGKVALDSIVYAGTPLAHYTEGTVQGLASITLEDVQAHWRNVFTQDRLILGLGGAVDEALAQQVKQALSPLAAIGTQRPPLPPTPAVAGKALILQKPALSTAISMGHATALRRGHPDFFAVAFAMSFLGEHRQSTGVLFNELREKRGLNYGDYAYAEAFQQEGYSTLPRQNVVRTQQLLSLWLRPVEPDNAVFATRGALYFLDRLLEAPVPQEAFDTARGFLQGYTRLWEQTDRQRLGQAIDARLYGTPDFLQSYRTALTQLTPEAVHAAVRRHVHPERLSFVYVAQDAEGLSEALRTQKPSPITYPTPKPASVLETDERFVASPLPIDAAQLESRAASQFMER